ncbi:MAG: secretin N-terminal domain-containing protein [Planctomycetota bacterium]
MKHSKSILWIIVSLAAIVIIGKIGFLVAEIRQTEKGTGLAAAAAAEPNAPPEVKKTSDPNTTEKVAEAEKPTDSNDSQRARPQRGPRPGGEAGREGRTGMFGASPEDRAGMEAMRARWENATDEEREELRAQMRERFGGRGRRGDRGQGVERGFGGDRSFGGERGFGGERRPGGRRPRDPNDPNAPAEPNEPAEPNKPSEPVDPNKIMENVNLKDVQMKDIIKKLADWTGKVIIPADDAMKQKITIYSTKRLPRTEAITMIYTALGAKGIVAKQTGNVIELKSLKDIRLDSVPTVQADYALAMIENKKQVVQKFFKLDNYGPTQMGQVVQPLVGDYGYVSADETTGQLLVIDTVENLMRIERIIDQFDVPEAQTTVTQIIPVEFGDPSEIVQMLKILLGENEGYSTMRYNRYRSDRSRSSSSSSSSRPRPPSQSGPSKSGDSKGEATSVVIGSTRGPVVLIPESRRKWIIAKASAEDMKQIEEWIKKLDMKEPIQSEYEVVQLRYADPREIEDSVGDGFRDLPGMEFLPSILIEPLYDTKQVIIFGRKDLRDIVKKMIEEIDVPPGQFETRHFRLKYADPDQIKANIDELYEEGMQSSSSRYSPYYSPWSRSRSSSSTSSEKVKVISYVSLKQVTVIASPENMLEIAAQIEQWDAPLDVNEVKPRIIELHNTDPVQMADLLTTLFSESSGGSSGRMSIYDIIYGRTEEKQKIVGPLYGQLTFESVPGTKKIIVISKIAEAYDVVEELIRELDKAEMGEVPTVITLKYANPEDLAERLNAMFNEPGTTATIQRTDRGLSDYSMEADSGASSSNQSGQDTTSQGEYRPWWTTGRQSIDEQPISEVIGRIRFVPDPRTKSLLVLSPPEFMENIEALIEALDIPGKQVMIKAVIMQIDHSNVTSLGLQLSSGGFSDVGENAITIFNSLDYLNEHGALVFGADGSVTGSGFGVGAGLSVTAMIDFLVKKTNAKILNQQTLWTKDNEEAMFFKGQRVAFFTTATSSATAGNVQNFEFQQVGMTLRVRPSITPENNVDMIINVILSQLTPDRINAQPVRTEMDTTTNMIIQHSQTLMLGGILFQTDSQVERKVPLLGDIPVTGGLFRHNSIEESNEELIVFITPYVIDEPDNLLPETKAEIEPSLEKLGNIKEELEALLQPDK